LWKNCEKIQGSQAAETEKIVVCVRMFNKEQSKV
jgi:hypothetical protein